MTLGTLRLRDLKNAFFMLFQIQVFIEVFTNIASTIFDTIHINLVDFDKSMPPDGSKTIDGDKRKVKQDDVIMDGTSFLFFPRG